jgi:hypothetical protein
MEEKTKVLLLEELYERVWTTPMRKLAQEFKYSDGETLPAASHTDTGTWLLAESRANPDRGRGIA